MQRPTKRQKLDKEALLSELEELLKESSFIQAYKASDVKTVKDFEYLKSVEEKTGVTILTDAVSRRSVEVAKKWLLHAIQKMWGLSCTSFEELNQHRNVTHGFGNSSFSYFFKHPPTEYAVTNICGDETYFDLNSVYSDVNLELLSHEDNRHITALILAFGGPGCMISWDSVKQASNPRPKPKSMTRQILTAPHIDIYGAELKRQQMIINADTGPTKLFFVPGSHRSEVKELISKILRKPSMYDSNGFISINDSELLSVLKKFAVAASPYSFVTWNSGIVHFEGRAAADKTYRGVYPFEDFTDTPNCERLRFIVGTQCPMELDRKALIKLALLAEQGLIPGPYVRNSSIVHKNCVHLKSTQWKKKRQLTEEEKKVMNAAVQNIDIVFTASLDSAEILEDVFNNAVLDPLKRHLYGVTQDIDLLPFNDNEKQLLK